MGHNEGNDSRSGKEGGVVQGGSRARGGHRRLFSTGGAALGAALMLAGFAAGAAEDLRSNPYAKADWSEAYIQSSGGVRLHADVLRPAGLTDTDKTPVILSVGPYFAHFAQEGIASPADERSWTSAPSTRFKDFVDGADIFSKGYTYVMVDLRGYGGSSGCADMLGPGEQADIQAAVEWAASQSWSTGKVGMYGKSYDGETGLAASGLRPQGLAAVVAQEPVYDNYRYVFGNGIPRPNFVGTPLIYAVIAGAPGVLGDTPQYQKNALADVLNPSCLLPGIKDQINPDHNAEFWKVRNLIPKAQGSTVPVFLTQGLIESNTAADGLQDYLEALAGPKRGWLGMWDHVRGADTNQSAGLSNASHPHALAMGRQGWYQEVVRFYDKYLKGIEPASEDPNFLIQDNTGSWRAQDAWPQDASIENVALTRGTYKQNGANVAAISWGSAGAYSPLTPGNPDSSLWTYSAPAEDSYRISGTPVATINTAKGARGNVAVDLYDQAPDGTATLITQNASRLDASGTTQFKLFSTDWLLAKGHRYVVRITDSNLLGRWLYNPVESAFHGDIKVTSASLELPTAPEFVGEPTEGQGNDTLTGYLQHMTYPVPAANATN